MSITPIEPNRKALEEKVDVGNSALTDALVALAEALGKYGFAGSVKLHLTVSLDHEMHGRAYAVLERSTSLKFQR